ncbi:hypothetical protein Vretifemale_10649 [Volvox reticuliferus]|uniref:Uncharacterized protein n=1 Tax=Volvox reticuliferus TaxID=1737510 RepID=A0A8J4FMU0_9CHLO|nr:hypothetical protein Vretifemale_10649 [Volvox reticuliferus]
MPEGIILQGSDVIVEPQLSGARQQRRAIDERSAKRDQLAVRTEEFGLAGLRPSLDDNTCTALLALRMGRGSSVGGLLNTAVSGPSGSSTENGLHQGECCSPKSGAKLLETSLSKGQLRHSTLRPSDSNERLEKLLASGRVGNAREAPEIPAQG